MIRAFEAEASVIGSVLLDDRCISDVAEILKPEDMKNPLHRDILRAAYQMREAGEKIDPVTLTSYMKKMGLQLNAQYIVDLYEVTPTVANVREYAQLVKKESMLNALKAIGQGLIEETYDDPLEKIAELEAELERIEQNTHQNLVDSLSMCKDFLEYRGKIDKNADDVYISTGFAGLDKLLGGGLLNEGLYIIGARPGMGKSTFALAVADNIAMMGQPVLFVTLEMSIRQLTAKRLARKSGVPSNVILMQQMSAEEYKKIAKASASISELPFYANKKIGATVSEIGAMATRIAGIKCIVVDYLGLIQPQEKRESSYEETTAISAALKSLARRMQIPVLCLAQLNRANEQRHSKIPTLSDLRGTGAIEQDADGVIFLHRPDYYSLDNKEWEYSAKEMNVILAKNRHGATGKVDMAFYPATSVITAAR